MLREVSDCCRELKNKHEGLSEQLKPHKDAFRSIKAKKEDLETKRKTKDKELKMKLKEEKSLNSEINELKNDCSELKEEVSICKKNDCPACIMMFPLLKKLISSVSYVFK